MRKVSSTQQFETSLFSSFSSPWCLVSEIPCQAALVPEVASASIDAARNCSGDHGILNHFVKHADTFNTYTWDPIWNWYELIDLINPIVCTRIQTATQHARFHPEGLSGHEHLKWHLQEQLSAATPVEVPGRFDPVALGLFKPTIVAYILTFNRAMMYYVQSTIEIVGRRLCFKYPVWEDVRWKQLRDENNFAGSGIWFVKDTGFVLGFGLLFL